MTKEEAIEMMIKSPRLRKEYFKSDFFAFCNYYFKEYFSFDTPDCLIKYYEALESGKNVYFEGFRGSAKTTIAQMYISYCIAYRNRRNIMRYSQTIDNAEENLTYIANSLINDTDQGARFSRDYGDLYYPETKIVNGQKKIKRIDKFITENDCYVRAMSLGTSPRGKNYTAPDGKYRPDLLIFDDIDTIASCQSRRKIEKNFEFMLNEVLGGTTAHTQIIFLGNTIYEDGLVPRFREHIQGDKSREIIRLPIYDKDNKIVWNRFVETQDEADKKNEGIRDINKRVISLEGERKRLGSISFMQNYLLQPYCLGQHIITRDMIVYDSNLYKYDKIQIGIDPAVSEKEGSDKFAITVVGFLGDKRYVLESIGLTGAEKNIKNATQVVYSLYHKRNATRLIVEVVAYQMVLKTIFRDMGLAVQEQKTTKDKTTRLMERQIMFEEHKIVFMPETTTDLVNELLEFPNGEHDDLVDSLLFGITENRSNFFISSLG